MKERIKELRKKLSLTQQEFADKLGIKRNTIANYEVGRNEPIDAIVSLICREFNVNENWLRNGVGSAFVEVSTFSLDEYAKQNNLTDIDIDVIRGFMEMDSKTRNSVYDLFRNVFTQNKSIYEQVPKTPEELERNFPPVDTNIDTKLG